MDLPEDALIAVQTLEDAGFTNEQATALMVEIQIVKDVSVSQNERLEILGMIEEQAKNGAELSKNVARQAESTANFLEQSAEYSETVNATLLDLMERVMTLEQKQ